MQTWRLLAILGTANLVVGIIVVGVGAAFDFMGKTPGQIVMVGVAMISGPFLILSKHAHAIAIHEKQRKSLEIRDLEAQVEERAAKAAALRAESIYVSRTGSFKALRRDDP